MTGTVDKAWTVTPGSKITLHISTVNTLYIQVCDIKMYIYYSCYQAICKI